jgi:acyl-CoA dehydrogenase
MARDFGTEPEFQTKLDCIETFLREDVEPVSHPVRAIYGPGGRERLIKPLQQKVNDQGL